MWATIWHQRHHDDPSATPRPSQWRSMGSAGPPVLAMASGLTTVASVRRCSAVCAVATAIATGFGQIRPVSATRMAIVTLRMLAERLGFEPRELSLYGFQGCSRAVARVRQRSI